MSTIPPLTEKQRHLLRHSLGLDENRTTAIYRNHYCAPISEPEAGLLEDLDGLVTLGLMRFGELMNGGNHRYYHVTDAGKVAVGAVDGERDGARPSEAVVPPLWLKQLREQRESERKVAPVQCTTSVERAPRQTTEQLQAHLAKMRGIHGDEPLRIKTALPWLEELIELRADDVRNREFCQRLTGMDLKDVIDGMFKATERDALMEALDQAREARVRLIADQYVPWPQAGGVNPCAHGRAAGIACPKCDRETVDAFFDGARADGHKKAQNTQNGEVVYSSTHKVEVDRALLARLVEAKEMKEEGGGGVATARPEDGGPSLLSAQDDSGVVAARPAVTHIMLDLETLGTTAGSVVFAIGAVAARDLGAGLEMINSDPFYAVISVEDAGNHGLQIDPQTLAWWMTQPEAARKELMIALGGKEPARSMEIALADFEFWLERTTNPIGINRSGAAPTPSDYTIWGNGAAFDPVLLVALYQAAKQPLPTWAFRQVRCYRTLAKLLPHVAKPERAPWSLEHHALNDAQWQMEHLIALLNTVEGKDEGGRMKDEEIGEETLGVGANL